MIDFSITFSMYVKTDRASFFGWFVLDLEILYICFFGFMQVKHLSIRFCQTFNANFYLPKKKKKKRLIWGRGEIPLNLWQYNGWMKNVKIE